MTPGVLELPVAFADARAADLGLHLSLPPQPALAVSSVEGDGWTAELRILGASHQVLVEQGGRLSCSETVACHLSHSNPLPDQHRPGSGYEFRSRVVRLDAGEFAGAVEALLRDHARAREGGALCARFPGDELGATALRLDPRRRGDGGWLSWRTWHSYPRTCEVVTTSSRLALAERSPAVTA